MKEEKKSKIRWIIDLIIAILSAIGGAITASVCG